MTLGTVMNRVNQLHFIASIGPLIGWCAPQWFGSARKIATMCTLSSGTPIGISSVAWVTAEWLQPGAQEKTGTARSILTLGDWAAVVTIFTAAKGASYLGYTTTYGQAVLSGAAVCCWPVLWVKIVGRRAPWDMDRRIPPAVWALAGFAVGKLAPQWITPIDGAKLMGGLAMADLYWLQIWNQTDVNVKDKPNVVRDLIGSVLISTAIFRLVPTTKLVHMALASGFFYTQRHVRAEFGYA